MHSGPEEGRRLDTLDFKEAGAVGVAQVGALFAGVSRSGITMVAGLLRGLDHEDAARFSFLLATPIILAAGVYKVPDLAGSLGDGVRGQALVGSIFAGLAAYVSVRFLMRFFETQDACCRSRSTASPSDRSRSSASRSHSGLPRANPGLRTLRT